MPTPTHTPPIHTLQILIVSKHQFRRQISVGFEHRQTIHVHLIGLWTLSGDCVPQTVTLVVVTLVVVVHGFLCVFVRHRPLSLALQQDRLFDLIANCKLCEGLGPPLIEIRDLVLVLRLFLLVDLEDRFLLVDLEDRFLRVDIEDRFLRVDIEDRFLLVDLDARFEPFNLVPLPMALGELYIAVRKLICSPVHPLRKQDGVGDRVVKMGGRDSFRAVHGCG